jgi:hypothetical protein
MGVRRRQPEPDPPPPPRAIVVDGSNVVASATTGAQRRIEDALAWARAFASSLPVTVFFDTATMRHLGVERETALLACVRAAGAEAHAVDAADPALLAFAYEQRALALTNDRFWDYEDLRRDVVLLQFVCDQRGFRVPDEATWFTPSGGARRVRVDALRP